MNKATRGNDENPEFGSYFWILSGQSLTKNQKYCNILTFHWPKSTEYTFCINHLKIISKSNKQKDIPGAR